VRKLALAIVLVLVMIGGAVGGLAAVNGAPASPTLNASGNSAPGPVIISGQGWTPGVQVNLYMDVRNDSAHYVAVATPNSKGKFSTTFTVGPTTLGNHEIIGIQNSTEVDAWFTLTSTQQVDNRTWDVLQGINDNVTALETKVNQIETELHNALPCCMAATVNSLGSVFVLNCGAPQYSDPAWKGWTSWVAAQSVTITTTGPGWVFLTASGDLAPQPLPYYNSYQISVGIGTSSAGPPDQASDYWHGYPSLVFPSYSVVHAYQVPSSGSYTYWLLAGGLWTQIEPGTFVAIFVPTL
jgi:hypothetical protein